VKAALPKWQQQFFALSAIPGGLPVALAEKLSDAAQAKYKSEWHNPEACIVVAAEKDKCCAKCEGTIPEGSTYISVGISQKAASEGEPVVIKPYHKGCQPYLLTIKSVVGKGLGPCGVGVQSTGVYGHLL
jgi:hypothetical protein